MGSNQKLFQNAIPFWLAPAPNAKLTHLAGAGSTLIQSGQGWITSISINTAASSGSMTVYDGTNASGTVMAVIDVSKQGLGIGTAPWGFQTGLFVVITGTPDITITSVAAQ